MVGSGVHHQDEGGQRFSNEKKFIGLVIQCVSAVDTSVRTITVDDIWQTIKDHSCTYVTGEDETDSDADEVFSLRDIEKTFKEGELMTEV